jgi:hypothetical protein
VSAEYFMAYHANTGNSKTYINMGLHGNTLCHFILGAGKLLCCHNVSVKDKNRVWFVSVERK